MLRRARRLLELTQGPAGSARIEPPLQDLGGFQAQAFDSSDVARRRAGVSNRPRAAKVREAYGRNIYGQSVLLARRLIEAGTRVACISWAPDANATWDTHGNNFTKLKNDLAAPTRPGRLQPARTILHDRGMLERTLVAVMGSSAASPKVNAGGRPRSLELLLFAHAGRRWHQGGIHPRRQRQDRRQPSSQPVKPADIIATIYHCLGIAKDHELQDRLARPFQLVPWGESIPEIVS